MKIPSIDKIAHEHFKTYLPEVYYKTFVTCSQCGHGLPLVQQAWIRNNYPSFDSSICKNCLRLVDCPSELTTRHVFRDFKRKHYQACKIAAEAVPHRKKGPKHQTQSRTPYVPKAAPRPKPKLPKAKALPIKKDPTTKMWEYEVIFLNSNLAPVKGWSDSKKLAKTYQSKIVTRFNQKYDPKKANDWREQARRSKEGLQYSADFDDGEDYDEDE